MPHLAQADTASLPKTSSITKSLRSRDAPLLSLLPTARDLYHSSAAASNVFFPRRNEWLLEWLAQRLKEDEGAAGRAARTSTECWDFLLELLRAADPPTVAGTLKRHGIVPLVAKVMEELRTREEYAAPGELLDRVAEVLTVLRGIASSESSIAAGLKASPEVAAGILGAFLRVCKQMVGAGEQVQRMWVDVVVDLWRGSIWGSANAKKTSAVWSEKCLEISATLLVAPEIDDSLKTVLENMLAEYIFSPEVLFPVGNAGQKQGAARVPSTKDLISLLGPLKQQDAAMSGTPEAISIPYLPVLFRIAIDAHSRKRTKADAAIVEALFVALLSVVAGVDLQSEVLDESASSGDSIASLLQILIETGTALSPSTLSRIVTKFANLTSSNPEFMRWSLVETALAIDFDTFLHPDVATLTTQLFSALSKARSSPQTGRVLRLVVDGFVKARDVMGFVARWSKQLKSGAEGDIWRSDELAGIFAPIVEDSLTSQQVVKAVGNLRQEKSWIVLDAILRGLRREETETQLLTSGTLEEVVETARKDGKDWRAWRLLVRIGGIKPELLVPAIKDATELVSAGKRWKEAVFASEVLMRVAEDTPEGAAMEGAQVVLHAVAKSLGRFKSWDRSIASVDKTNFGHVVATAVIGGHLAILEKVDTTHRREFVDSLLGAALDGGAASGPLDAAQLCQALLGRPEFYEHPAVKEAMLSALVTRLPFEEDMAKSAADLPTLSPKNRDQYSFFVSLLELFPLEAIKRTTRERILDTCLLLDIVGFSRVRPLMQRLWKVGNAGSFMATDCQVIKMLFTNPGAADIFRRVLSHAFINRDQEKTKEYLTSLIRMNYSLVKGARKGDGLSAGELEMSWVVITELWKFRSEAAINSGDLEKTRKWFLELLAKTVGSKKRVDATALKYWRQVWELERDDRDAALEIAARVAGRVTKVWGYEVPDADIVVETIGVVSTVAESVEDMMNVTAFSVVSSQVLKRERDADLLRHYKCAVDRLDITTHRDVSRRVVDACFSDEIGGDFIWELFKILINAIKKPETPEELSASIDVFSAAHSRLLISLPSSLSPSAFILNAHCINTLLRLHPWAIIQHNVDATISSLTIAASAHGPSLTATDTDTLYASLTSILSTILSLHRHRIRGRYHLVVALLQTLLTVLFTPKLSRRKTERALHPPWLLSTTATPLTLHSARVFARVLQAFCDPPVSTVRSHNSELTDSERSKERKMVGNVVGPVLETFIKRVLEERVDAAVRREINVGVDKMLEVLGREGMRRVTGRMNAEGRAVVRALWVEFGRGRGERV